MRLPSCQWKDIAGNAYPARIAGALAMFMLANVVRREVGTIQKLVESIQQTDGYDADDEAAQQPSKVLKM